MWAAAAHSRKT